MNEVGRPINPESVRRIEVGERRVDVDDLVALATVLDVTVIELISPPGECYTRGPYGAKRREEMREFDQTMLDRVQRIEQALTAAKIAVDGVEMLTR